MSDVTNNPVEPGDEDRSCSEAPSELTLDGSVPVVEIRGLQTKFGRTVIHNDLDLTIEQGEIMSIVGGSGTGKTVLLRQMLGLEKPSKGCVRIFGEDITQAKAHLGWEPSVSLEAGLKRTIPYFETLLSTLPAGLMVHDR